jgi:hypothetical protein
MKICFWGNIAGALNGRTDGGAELQMAIIAKALAKAGHEVIVVDYETKEDFITEDGIKVARIPGFNSGIRYIRIFTHRIPLLYQSLIAQNADIYYCRIRDFKHILVYFVSHKLGSKYVMHMASDLDAMNFVMKLNYFRSLDFSTSYNAIDSLLVEIVYKWMLRRADLVLAQHSGQKIILQKRNIKSKVLFNLIDLSKFPNSSNTFKHEYVYVGSLERRKGFVEFYELVTKSPDHKFKVIGAPRDKIGSYYFEKLKSFPNVILMGKLSHYDTLVHMSKSKALISTSLMEGFPNIFIEAWAFGIPVLSLYVDPGHVIRDEKLGIVTYGDIDKLKIAMDNTVNTTEFAIKAKAYVDKNHALNDDKIKEINDLFTFI